MTAPSAPFNSRQLARTWLGQVGNAALYLSGLVVLAGIVIYFSQQQWMRVKLDATKTRAYSLSPQTRMLLDGLDEPWTIALIMVEAETDSSTRRQVDEVLRRFTETSPLVTVRRLDPTDPGSLRQLETILAQLRQIDREVIEQYETALDDGMDVFYQLHVFCQQHATGLQQLVESLPEDHANREDLTRRAQVIGLWAEQAGAVAEQVLAARRIDADRPLPDYETARGILAGTLAHWANEIFDVVQIFDQWPDDDPSSPAGTRQFIGSEGPAYDGLARNLAAAADPLRRLPRLELTAIGRQLQRGDTAIVIGPKGAALIPPGQLFPQSRIQNTSTGAVTYDRRFRGEQVIASTMRSLIIEHLPMVVFLHAEASSLFTPTERSVDLVGVNEALTASRFDVREWIVHQTQRPTPEQGQPVVWVPIQPPQRKGRDASPEEKQLISTVQRLIAEGQPMLLSLYPSVLHRLSLPDPWADCTAAFNLEADTSAVVYESLRVGSETQIERGQTLRRYQPGHPITSAIEGQQSYFSLPVALSPAEEVDEAVQLQPLIQVEAGDQRWRESQWFRPTEQVTVPDLADRMTEPAVIAMAAERPNPIEPGRQRMVVVGSGGWMLSFVADLADNLGGDRFALRYPANFELMQASIAWLAGMDELIAPSPASQEVSRLHGVTTATRRGWMLFSMIGLPGACLLLGFSMWMWRRG